MTVLVLRPFRDRGVEALLGPGALTSVLGAIRRRVSEAAACHAGESITGQEISGAQIAGEEHDFAVVWRGRPKGEAPPLRACRAAWDIVHRLARQEAGLARQYGMALCPHIGIASDGQVRAASAADERLVRRAHVLRRANRLYGTTILADGFVAAAANRRMAFREVDRVGSGGHSLLRGPEAAALAGIQAATLGVFGPTPGGIHELLGPQGAVPITRRSAALAFDGARALYEAGDWSKAAAIFALLAHGSRPDPLAARYLHTCLQLEEEDRRFTIALTGDSPAPAVRPDREGDPNRTSGSSLPAATGGEPPDASGTGEG